VNVLFATPPNTAFVTFSIRSTERNSLPPSYSAPGNILRSDAKPSFDPSDRIRFAFASRLNHLEFFIRDILFLKPINLRMNRVAPLLASCGLDRECVKREEAGGYFVPGNPVNPAESEAICLSRTSARYRPDVRPFDIKSAIAS